MIRHDPTQGPWDFVAPNQQSQLVPLTELAGVGGQKLPGPAVGGVLLLQMSSFLGFSWVFCSPVVQYDQYASIWFLVLQFMLPRFYHVLSTFFSFNFSGISRDDSSHLSSSDSAGSAHMKLYSKCPPGASQKRIDGGLFSTSFSF